MGLIRVPTNTVLYEYIYRHLCTANIVCAESVPININRWPGKKYYAFYKNADSLECVCRKEGIPHHQCVDDAGEGGEGEVDLGHLLEAGAAHDVGLGWAFAAGEVQWQDRSPGGGAASSGQKKLLSAPPPFGSQGGIKRRLAPSLLPGWTLPPPLPPGGGTFGPSERPCLQGTSCWCEYSGRCRPPLPATKEWSSIAVQSNPRDL